MMYFELCVSGLTIAELFKVVSAISCESAVLEWDDSLLVSHAIKEGCLVSVRGKIIFSSFRCELVY